MNLGKNDLHMLLDRGARTLRLFAPGGAVILSCEARTRAVNDSAPVNERYAPCPPGEFLLGPAIAKNTVPFGPWFLGLVDYDGHTGMGDNHRGGIGLHGGGSGLIAPFAPQQGWVWTLGCWRLANQDLESLVKITRPLRASGGRTFVTVAAPTPGAGLSDPNDWVLTDPLAPGE